MFLFFQIHKLFIVIFKTFTVPSYRVYIIVSECILFITIFVDLNLDFNLKRHYSSWGTSAYFPRGTSALRPHHSKCCIMLIIMMRLYSNTVVHVRARAYLCACARANIGICADECVYASARVWGCSCACMCVH